MNLKCETATILKIYTTHRQKKERGYFLIDYETQHPCKACNQKTLNRLIVSNRNFRNQCTSHICLINSKQSPDSNPRFCYEDLLNYDEFKPLVQTIIKFVDLQQD